MRFANCTRVDVHVDLHETTDTDNSEFGPAKGCARRRAVRSTRIPDGFYLVADKRAAGSGISACTDRCRAPRHSHRRGR
jgi:hypothetical protein